MSDEDDSSCDGPTKEELHRMELQTELGVNAWYEPKPNSLPAFISLPSFCQFPPKYEGSWCKSIEQCSPKELRALAAFFERGAKTLRANAKQLRDVASGRIRLAAKHVDDVEPAPPRTLLWQEVREIVKERLEKLEEEEQGLG